MSSQVKSYRDLIVWQKGIIAHRLKYVNDAEAQTLDQRITELHKMLNSLIARLN